MLTIADFFPVPVDLELKHPVTGEGLGVSVRLVGFDSTECRNARRVIFKRNTTRDALPDAFEQIDLEDEILSSLIVGWSSDEFFETPFSKEAALKLVSDPGMAWLKEQLDACLSTRKNFFRSSSGTGRASPSGTASA